MDTNIMVWSLLRIYVIVEKEQSVVSEKDVGNS